MYACRFTHLLHIFPFHNVHYNIGNGMPTVLNAQSVAGTLYNAQCTIYIHCACEDISCVSICDENGVKVCLFMLRSLTVADPGGGFLGCHGTPLSRYTVYTWQSSRNIFIFALFRESWIRKNNTAKMSAYINIAITITIYVYMCRCIVGTPLFKILDPPLVKLSILCKKGRFQLSRMFEANIIIVILLKFDQDNFCDCI